MRALRRQYSSGYLSNERLAPLLSTLSRELDARTEPLLGDAPASLGSLPRSSSSGASSLAGSSPASCRSGRSGRALA